MFINRQRQLPGDDFTNKDLVVLSSMVRHLATSLRMMADPAGRGVLDPLLIRAEAWPAGPDGVEWPSVDDVETFLLELAQAGWLRMYPDPDGTGVELFQILARWPKVQKEGEPQHAPPPPESRTIPPFLTPAVGGVSAGERERTCEGVSERAGAGLSRTTFENTPPTPAPSTRLKLTPSPFCSVHPGGPPEQLDCRDCGTARGRSTRHLELKGARIRAEQLDATLRPIVLAQIDAEMHALEAAAGAALLGRRPSQEEPSEFVDEHGRIETT